MPLATRIGTLSSGDSTFAESGLGALVLVPAKREMASAGKKYLEKLYTQVPNNTNPPKG